MVVVGEAASLLLLLLEKGGQVQVVVIGQRGAHGPASSPALVSRGVGGVVLLLLEVEGLLGRVVEVMKTSSSSSCTTMMGR